MSKYKNKKMLVTEDGTMFEIEALKKHNITDITGEKFDSKAEAEYYVHIKFQRPDIIGYQLQPVFVLQDKPKIKYTADFLLHFKDGINKIVDVKGMQTQAFRLKLRMFKAKFPDLQLMLVKKKGRGWEEMSA